MDTYSKVVSIIGEQLGIPASSISRESDILILYQRQLFFILERIHCLVTDKRNKRNKELRSYNVRFGIFVRHIHDTGVVEFAVRFE